MPQFIVDLSQDSDDDEFYVAQQFQPAKRSPPTLLPSKPSPLKKQARTPRRPISSSSSPLSFTSSPSRKIQQPITSFLSSPNIKREPVVQKSITSFFPFPSRRLQHVYSNPMPPRILFMGDELRVDDDEAPVPESFEVTGMYASGLSAESPAEITSSPPASFEVVAVNSDAGGGSPRGSPAVVETISATSRPLISPPLISPPVAMGAGPGEKSSIAEHVRFLASVSAEEGKKHLSNFPLNKQVEIAIAYSGKGLGECKRTNVGSNKRPFAGQQSMPLKNGDNEGGKRRAIVASRSGTSPDPGLGTSGGSSTPEYFAVTSRPVPNVSTDVGSPFSSLPPKCDGKEAKGILGHMSSRFKVIFSNDNNISDIGNDQDDGGDDSGMETQDCTELGDNCSARFHNSTPAVNLQQSNTPAPTPNPYNLPPPQGGFDPIALLKEQELARKNSAFQTAFAHTPRIPGILSPLGAEYNPSFLGPIITPQPTQAPTEPLPQPPRIVPRPVIMSRSPSPLTLSPESRPLTPEDNNYDHDHDNDNDDDDDDDDDDFPTGLTKPKVNEKGEIICPLHNDPECLEPECVHAFFEKYCPFQHTVPDENERVYVDFVPRHKMPTVPVEVVDEVTEPAKTKRELIAMMIASGELGKERRLPYLNVSMKNYIRNNANKMMSLMKCCNGELIHVQLTANEVLLLGNALVNYIELRNPHMEYPPQSDNLHSDIHYLLATGFAGCTDLRSEFKSFLTTANLNLDGRYNIDLLNFMEDAFVSVPDPHDPFILIELRKKVVLQGAITRRAKMELGLGNIDPMLAMRGRYNDVFGMLEPVWKFGEGSSDIHDIVWSKDGSRFGMATTCFNDGYNRPGNLMLGTVDPWKVKMLYRHAFRVRAQASGNLEKYSYATVSSIRFSNDSSLLFSSGYDGFVKVWKAKDSSWISDIHLNDQIMLMESSRTSSNLLAAGCFKGSVNILRLDDSGFLTSSTALHISKTEELKKCLYPSCFEWGNKNFSGLLVTGYDNSAENQRHGGLAIWDVEYSRNLFKGSTKGFGSPQRHFDVSMHVVGGAFVTASLKSGRYAKGSVVRLYDLADMKGVVEFDSPQTDINRVTISPCQRYITSSGTNGSTLVWDVRYPGNTLVELKHDASVLPITEATNVEAEDTGVTFAQWGQYNDVFFTGSSDGKVKQWDITTGTPFIRDIAQVDTQIMSACFSPSWDELIVGECSGTATLFSTRGDKGVPPSKIVVDWTEEEGKINPNEENMPYTDWDGRRGREEVEVEVEQEESGVQMARDLVDEGLMWVDDKGMAWATDKYEKMIKQQRKGKGKA